MRRWLRIAGAGAVLAGFGAVALREHATDLPVSQVTLSIASVAALFLGLWFVGDRRLSEAERATSPDTEHGYQVPVPGEGIDRALEGRPRTKSVKRRLRERVRVTLVERGLSSEDADAAVEHGAWTDDRVAAAFLASDGSSVPLATRLRWLLRGDLHAERCVQHAVAALEALREGPDRE